MPHLYSCLYRQVWQCKSTSQLYPPGSLATSLQYEQHNDDKTLHIILLTCHQVTNKQYDLQSSSARANHVSLHPMLGTGRLLVIAGVLARCVCMYIYMDSKTLQLAYLVPVLQQATRVVFASPPRMHKCGRPDLVPASSALVTLVAKTQRTQHKRW